MINKQTKIVIAIEMFLAFYLLLSITVSEFDRYKVEKYIQSYELENQEIATKNRELGDMLDYHSSSEYQQKIAKQNFGLVLDGEKVLIIPNDSIVSDSLEFENNINLNKQLYFSQMPNYKKWFFYFFGY